MSKARLEVEAKARVRDPEAARSRLRETGRRLDEIDYNDTYYVPADSEGFSHHRFRLRRAGDRAWVTFKESVAVDGCEASREHEFEVSDPDRFRAFARVFGFKVMIEKRKRGDRWRIESGPDCPGRPPAVAEVIEVVGLGYFLEIEIMVDEEAEICAARDRLAELFAGLGVRPGDFERAPYTLMLYNLPRRHQY